MHTHHCLLLLCIYVLPGVYSVVALSPWAEYYQSTERLSNFKYTLLVDTELCFKHRHSGTRGLSLQPLES